MTGILRRIIKVAAQVEGCSLNDLTVLRREADPYRLDTASGRRDGEWVAEQLAQLIPAHKTIHLRGLHYAIVVPSKIRKPDGAIYTNTDPNWEWLAQPAAKAARWLGYVPFNRITDGRNDEPRIFRSNEPRFPARPCVIPGSISIELPSHAYLKPIAALAGSIAKPQPYALAIFGEKSSLKDVLLPIAEDYAADLYLGAGEPSNTHLYSMAFDAFRDGRPLIVFTCTDCDPSGYQMSTSIGRKLQAFRDLLFPDLQFEVHPVALTVEQVKELDLPSTPLKDTERRGDNWKAAYGVEQTEIDALATLNPDLLTEIVTEAIDPYFDRTLDRRKDEAERNWQVAARAILERKIDGDAVAALEREAVDLLATTRAGIDAINKKAARFAKGKITFPPIPKIEPEIDATPRDALISTDMSWVEATKALIARKRFGEEP